MLPPAGYTNNVMRLGKDYLLSFAQLTKVDTELGSKMTILDTEWAPSKMTISSDLIKTFSTS